MPTYFLAPLVFSVCLPTLSASPHLANGVKVGEVDTHSALVWTRLTQTPTADFGRLPILTEGLVQRDPDEGEIPTDLLPGAAGEVRLKWWPADAANLAKKSTAWEAVSLERDFTHQFALQNLEPNTRYAYTVEGRAPGGEAPTATATGQFHTAPAAEAAPPIRFIVTTCQAVRSVDSGAEGHLAYQQMLAFKPHFLVHTGDILYYDKAPLAKSLPQARAKWNLMFAYGYNQYFHQNVTSYFMKDDHDTLKNDCWPGQTYGELTFDQGLAIFREQVPMGEKTYRTFRWGSDVQIWLTENRDFRSPNTQPDGAEKTILGDTQKNWLKKTLRESTATYKFVISPGPIVGPDKSGKNDNHSNPAFQHEGQELRDFLSALPNTYVICGDRHWQYLSKDPGTGLMELGCGPINDEHRYGDNTGNVPAYHRFFSGKGGFLGITVEDGQATARWFGLDADSPEPPIRFTQRLERVRE